MVAKPALSKTSSCIIVYCKKIKKTEAIVGQSLCHDPSEGAGGRRRPRLEAAHSQAQAKGGDGEEAHDEKKDERDRRSGVVKEYVFLHIKEANLPTVWR